MVLSSRHPPVWDRLGNRPKLVRRQRFESLPLAVQDADVWAEEFVRRAGKIVAINVDHVDQPVRSEVDGIDKDLRSYLVRRDRYLSNRIDGPSDVRRISDGDEFCARREF